MTSLPVLRYPLSLIDTPVRFPYDYLTALSLVLDGDSWRPLTARHQRPNNRNIGLLAMVNPSQRAKKTIQGQEATTMLHQEQQQLEMAAQNRVVVPPWGSGEGRPSYILSWHRGASVLT